jgi:HrpA-like RNA helicase
MPTLQESGNICFVKYDDSKATTLIPLESSQKSIDYIIKYIDAASKKHGGVEDRFLVLQAKTASGKSTILPNTLYQHFENVTIGCTEPRVATAVEIPNDITQYNKYYKKQMILGENIGYQTRYLRKAPRKGLVFMVLQVLGQQFKTMTDDEICNRYDFIILDEAHERSVDFDILFLMIKKFIQRNYSKPRCPYFIFMSATLDPILYCKYVLSNVKATMTVDHDGGTVDVYKNIIYVKGFNYPISRNYATIDTSDYLKDAYDKCVELHTKNEADYAGNMRDIIVFIVSGSVILKLKEQLDAYNATEANKFKFMTIIYDRDNVNKQNVSATKLPLDKLSVTLGETVWPIHRRIILATTVAETGLTLDTLKYVIDGGWAVSKEFYPNYNCNAVLSRPIFKSMGRQRRGRAGRKAPGEWHPLYTKETWKSLENDQLPDVIRNDVAREILYILYVTATVKTNDVLGYDEYFYDISNIYELFTCPSFDMIHYSMEKLFGLGYIDEHKLTPLAILLFKTSIDSLEFFRMIMAGIIFNVCILDLVDSYCYHTTQDLDRFMKKFIAGQIEQSDMKYQDDFIQCVFTIHKYENKGLDFSQYYSFIEKQHQTIEELQTLNFDIYAGLSYDNIVDRDSYISQFKKCIYEGFKYNALSLHGEKYISDQRHMEVNILSDVKTTSKRIIVKDISLANEFKISKKGYSFVARVVSPVDGYATDSTLL